MGTNAKAPVVLLALLLGLTLAACGSSSGSGDGDADSDLDADADADTDVDADADTDADSDTDTDTDPDWCADEGRYDDGTCDPLCPQPDVPDCTAGGEDYCEEHGLYDDEETCHRGCPAYDPDCDDRCLAEGAYGDGHCDEDCHHPDPDCGDWCANEGKYDDGHCDEDCPEPDPDCCEASVSWTRAVTEPASVVAWTENDIVFLLDLDIDCAEVADVEVRTGDYGVTPLVDDGTGADAVAGDHTFTGLWHAPGLHHATHQFTSDFRVRPNNAESYPMQGPVFSLEVGNAPDAELTLTPLPTEPPVVATGTDSAVVFRVQALATGGAEITAVTIDLTSLGGDAAAHMGQRGEEEGEHGNHFIVRGDVPVGEYTLPVSATASGDLTAETEVALEVVGEAVLEIVSAVFTPNPIEEFTTPELTLEVTTRAEACQVEMVRADLEALGGQFGTDLQDDGVAPDTAAGDGIYTLTHTLPEPLTPGLHTVSVDAFGMGVGCGDTVFGEAILEVQAVPKVVLTDPTAAPWYVRTDTGGEITLTVAAAGADGGTLTGVTADLTAVGGPPDAEMLDDGISGGDLIAGDGIHVVAVTVPGVPDPAVATLTINATGEDGGGNPLAANIETTINLVRGYTVTRTAADLVSIESDESRLGSGEWEQPVTLAFDVHFYGEIIPAGEQIWVTGWGTIGLLGGNGPYRFTARDVAGYLAWSEENPAWPCIAAYHDGMYEPRGIWAETSGAAPDRVLTIEWQADHLIGWPEPGWAQFQLKLFEDPAGRGGDFAVVYGHMDDDEIARQGRDWAMVAIRDALHFDEINVPDDDQYVSPHDSHTHTFSW